MNPRALWASVQRWYATHSTRDRRILLGVGLAIVASAIYLGIVDPVLAYRKHVLEETADGLEELERSARFLNAGESLHAEREQLKKRLEEAKSRLLPGDSGTLGAAALQERANAIAAAKGITVQSTQVMREEAVDPFRKVSVRLTISGELKPFADFVSSLEYGPQQLNLPFVEISRRGAVAGQKGPRTLSATVEVSGYLHGANEKEAKPEEAAPPDGEKEAAEGETPPAAGEADAGKAPAGADAKASGGEGKPAGSGEGGEPKPPAEGAPPKPSPDGAPETAAAPPTPPAGARGEAMPVPADAPATPPTTTPAAAPPPPSTPVPPTLPPAAAPPAVPPPSAPAANPPPPAPAAPAIPVPSKGAD